jgi:hypothetical protein
MKREIRLMLDDNMLKSGEIIGGYSTNPVERKVAEEYAAKGWTVLRGGWPDFLMTREVGGITEVLGVEVKAGRDTLDPGQELMHKALPFKTVVERR